MSTAAPGSKPIRNGLIYIGEAAAGDPPNDAHVNLYMGPQSGPVGTALVTAAATPRAGYIPLATVLRPNVLVKPYTLFVAKTDVRSERQANLFYGAAQIGVADGIYAAFRKGMFPEEAEDEWCIVASIWMDWAADNDDSVYQSNREAAYESARRGLLRFPDRVTLEDAHAHSGNRYYQPKK